MVLFALSMGILLLVVLAYWLGHGDGQRGMFERLERYLELGLDLREVIRPERRRLGLG